MLCFKRENGTTVQGQGQGRLRLTNRLLSREKTFQRLVGRRLRRRKMPLTKNSRATTAVTSRTATSSTRNIMPNAVAPIIESTVARAWNLTSRRQWWNPTNAPLRERNKKVQNKQEPSLYKYIKCFFFRPNRQHVYVCISFIRSVLSFLFFGLLSSIRECLFQSSTRSIHVPGRLLLMMYRRNATFARLFLRRQNWLKMIVQANRARASIPPHSRQSSAPPGTNHEGPCQDSRPSPQGAGCGQR